MTNNKTIRIFAAAVMTLGLSTAWAAGTMDNMKKKMSGAATTTESEIREHAADRSIVLSFDKGVAALSAEQQAKLRTLVSTIGLDHVERIEVAGWSDKAFPKTGSDLAKADRDLADKRISNINDYLKTDMNVSTLDIKNFNMAETSNWLARAFRSDEAELKSVFAKNASAPMARVDFNTIVREGAPSKAVVVVVRK